MSSVTTSTRLLRANNLLYNQYYKVKKFSYIEHPATTCTILCVKLLVVSEIQCICPGVPKPEWILPLACFITCTHWIPHMHLWVRRLSTAANLLVTGYLILISGDRISWCSVDGHDCWLTYSFWQPGNFRLPDPLTNMWPHSLQGWKQLSRWWRTQQLRRPRRIRGSTIEKPVS